MIAMSFHFLPLPLRHCARLLLGTLSLGAAVGASPLAAQDPSPSITVSGAVPNALTLTAADLATLPRAAVTTTSNGISTTYAGVWLSDVLASSGLVLGAQARGSSLSSYVLAVAADGYQVIFSLGEVDPGITEGRYLVADQANGKPMFGETGAFRLVVPGDKRGARSLRMLAELHVVAVPRGANGVR